MVYVTIIKTIGFETNGRDKIGELTNNYLSLNYGLDSSVSILKKAETYLSESILIAARQCRAMAH